MKKVLPFGSKYVKVSKVKNLYGDKKDEVSVPLRVRRRFAKYLDCAAKRGAEEITGALAEYSGAPSPRRASPRYVKEKALTLVEPSIYGALDKAVADAVLEIAYRSGKEVDGQITLKKKDFKGFDFGICQFKGVEKREKKKRARADEIREETIPDYCELCGSRAEGGKGVCRYCGTLMG